MILNLGPTNRGNTFVQRFSRLVAIAGVVVYLAAIVGFLLQSVVGDSRLFPLSYFFTWDMFPAHNTRSMHRVAIGKTASGNLLQLQPSPRDQYRAGMERDFTRIDLEGRGFFYRTAVEATVAAAAARDPADPVTHVYLFEKSRPAKFNYPGDLYEAWSGTPRPDRVAWRLVDEFDVSRQGRVVEAPGGDGP
jgi:hypothetical protein